MRAASALAWFHRVSICSIYRIGRLLGDCWIILHAIRHALTRGGEPTTSWARGPGGKPMLQCAVYLNGGRRLTLSLNTADTEVEEPQRMRLILWHAIAEGQLPKDKNHPAWRYYGGAIPQSIKGLLASRPCRGRNMRRSARLRLQDWASCQQRSTGSQSSNKIGHLTRRKRTSSSLTRGEKGSGYPWRTRGSVVR
jgi:hypothetical protein